MVDQFFTKSRPFTKRPRESSTSRRGTGSSRSSSAAEGGRRATLKQASTKPSGSRYSNRPNIGSSAQLGRTLKDDTEIDEAQFGSDDEQQQSNSEGDDGEASDAEDTLETPAQKRLRLSQGVGFDAADLDRELIADRLQKDVLHHSGKLHRFIAKFIRFPVSPTQVYHTPSRTHRGCITSAVSSQDASWLYTASKDGSLIKWDMRELSSITGPAGTRTETADGTTLQSKGPSLRINKAVHLHKQLRKDSGLSKNSSSAMSQQHSDGKGKGKAIATAPLRGHSDEILCLDLSSDGSTLASGGKDKLVGVWDVSGADAKWVRGLSGHKDRVGSVVFRQGTQELYSSSFDRTLKIFDLSTFSYVETLFGHQDSIQHLAALRNQVAVSAGGRDKTVRYWKVTEESQLVFRGGAASRTRNVLDGALENDGIDEVDSGESRRKKNIQVKAVEGSIECVAMVDDSTFLSGGDSGSICLWTITKKKPLAIRELAHGTEIHDSASEGVVRNPRWITALAALPYSDIFASGSWDGSIRIWRIDERVRSFDELSSIPALGFVNSLQLITPSTRNDPRVEPDGTEDTAADFEKLVLIAALSKEPRFGRWNSLHHAKECALVAIFHK